MSTLASFEQVYKQLGNNIYDPTVQSFYDSYVDEGCLSSYVDILNLLPVGAREMVLSAQETQVHKEKALWSVFFARSYGFDIDMSVKIGASTEILWGLSTVIDDILDNDPSRNGKEAEWSRLGKSHAIAHAVSSLEQTLSYLSETVDPQIAKMAYQYVKIGVDSIGRHHKMSFEAPEGAILNNYIERDGFHTTFPIESVFFLCAGSDNRLLRELDQLRLGLILFNQAGQIANDLSDIWNPMQELVRLNDLREGHITIAIRTLADVVSTPESRHLNRLFGVRRDYSPYEIGALAEMVRNPLFIPRITRRITDTYSRSYKILAPRMIPGDASMLCNWIVYKTKRYDK